MRRRFIFAAMAALVASGARAAEPTWSPPATEHEAQAAPAWASDITSSLSVGDPAPAFSYLGIDGGWHDSRGLWANGPVLLVFGAAREQLVELDRARSALGDLGVRTAAVLDMRAGSAAKLARRLELALGVVVDPQCAIAGLYGSIDPVTRHHAPSFFVLDARGTIRGGGRGPLPPMRRLSTITARSLGQPLPVSWSPAVPE